MKFAKIKKKKINAKKLKCTDRTFNLQKKNCWDHSNFTIFSFRENHVVWYETRGTSALHDSRQSFNGWFSWQTIEEKKGRGTVTGTGTGTEIGAGTGTGTRAGTGTEIGTGKWKEKWKGKRNGKGKGKGKGQR